MREAPSTCARGAPACRRAGRSRGAATRPSATVWVCGVQRRPCCPPPIPQEAADSQHPDRADATAAGSSGTRAGGSGLGHRPLLYPGTERVAQHRPREASG